MPLKEFIARGPQYSLLLPDAPEPTLSYGEACQAGQYETSEFGGEALVIRDAHSEGKWGEHVVARFVNGVKVFPFPLPEALPLNADYVYGCV